MVKVPTKVKFLSIVNPLWLATVKANNVLVLAEISLDAPNT